MILVAACASCSAFGASPTPGSGTVDSGVPDGGSTTPPGRDGGIGTNLDGGVKTSWERAVTEDSPAAWFRLDEPPNVFQARDVVSGLVGQYGALVLHDQPSLLAGDPDRAATFGPPASTGLNGILHVAPNKALEPANALTVECWVQLIGGTAAPVSLVAYGDSASCGPSYHLGVDAAGGTHFYMCNIGDSTGPVVSNGSPHHVVVTYDGSQTKIYVDAVAGVAVPQSNALSYGTPAGLGIGGTAVGDDTNSATIDEIVLYDHALSGDRVAAHFKAAATN